MEAIARRHAVEGLVLRSGASPGADRAFQRGAEEAGGAVELYLPWPSYGCHTTGEEGPRKGEVLVFGVPLSRCLRARGAVSSPLRRAAREGARSCWPATPIRCSAPICEPLGALVVLDSGREPRRRGPLRDGTGQALRIARAHEVPVFNLARPEHAGRLR